MTPDFYHAFEDRYRGSRDLIKSRLQVYIPFVQPLLAHYPKASAIDLGCGRGEWLELALAAGFDANGVDLDAGMLAHCQAHQLPARQADALEVLRTLPTSSQAFVSAIHVVEHIDFAQLELLVNESLRVLLPGGLLILESPNSENLTVGTSSFYLDPTHNRPVHPQLLSFLVEYAGFARSRVLRLSEDPELIRKRALGLYDVFAGASPDFAVIAQKPAPAEILATFDHEFHTQHGLALTQLAHHYDELLEHRLGRVELLEQRLARVDNRAQSRLEELAGEIDSIRGQVVHLEALLKQHQEAARMHPALTRTRALVGRALRRGMPLLRAGIAHVPPIKRAASAVLRSSPWLANLITRFLPPPPPPPHPLPCAPQRFEDLRSVRVMHAVAALPDNTQSVTFLEIGDHAK